MASNTLPSMRSLAPIYQDSTTPGSLFLTRRPMFTSRRDELFHYKLDNVDLFKGRKNLDGPRRATVNVTFNPIKNNSDPYVDASNWLPKFKEFCKGYIARKNAETLKNKNQAAVIIQRAAESHLDPWVQLFKAIRPTLKVATMDELKKYLRDCIIQIKKLNSERGFVENQLVDVENMMEQSLQTSDNAELAVESRRSPNALPKLDEVQQNDDNETFLKECLDIDLKGIIDVKVTFDPMSCQNSKVHSVYELAEKLQKKLLEDRTELQTLQAKCQNMEKENSELRNTNVTSETTIRTLRGLVNKHDINLHDQKDKVQDYVAILEKLNEEKKCLMSKIKVHEKKLLEKDEELVATNSKCEYFETELDSKTKMMDALNQEKLRYDKKIKELEDKLKFNIENQSELESTIDLQKTRYTDLKKRLSEQIKAAEEELMQTINTSKLQIKDQAEFIEMQEEKIKQDEEIIRKLEGQIEESRQHNCSDDETDFERRRMGQKLKNANETIETLKEDIRLMEYNNEQSKSRIEDLQSNLEKSNEETTEHKKIAERLKAQIQSSNSALNDTELKLNRANRERNFNSQKLAQAKQKNEELESELTKLHEDIYNNCQIINSKNREVESLNDDFSEAKKAFENKINILEKNFAELQEKLDQNEAHAFQNSENWKNEGTEYENKITELQQRLEKKQNEINEYNKENIDYQTTVKKLQRKIKEQDEIQEDNDKTITKLKDHIKTLQEENESQWNTMTSPGMNSPMDPRLHDLQSISRSPSSLTASPFSRTERYSTMPSKRPVRQ